jgi:transcriptional regulator with XRE-family HTH domain
VRRVFCRRRCTLAEADAANSIETSASTLSRLESGAKKPTLDLLLPLARLYGVALDDIVGAPPTGDPRIRPHPIKRGGMIYVPLTREGGPIQAFKIILPGRRALPSAPQAHTGYEWLYVLSGALDLQLAGNHTILETGEAAEFDTRTPHVITSADKQTVEVLGLFSPQGERIHIRGT